MALVIEVGGGESAYFQAQLSVFVFETTERWDTWDIDASASPLKPYVCMCARSEYDDSLDVVKRSARIGRSDFWAR